MRGFIEDSFLMLIFMFVFVLLFVIASFVSNTMGSSGDANIDLHMGEVTTGLRSFNSLAPLFVVGSGIALIASAAFIRSQPALFFIFMVVQLIFAYLSIQMSNVYYSLFSSGPLGAEAQANFGMWNLVFQYFPIIAIVLAVIFAVVMFNKGE